MNEQDWIQILKKIFSYKNMEEMDLDLSEERIKSCSENEREAWILKEGSNKEKYWVILKNGLKHLKIPSKYLPSLNPTKEMAKIIIFCDSYDQKELKKIFSDNKNLEIIEIWKEFLYRHLVNIEMYGKNTSLVPLSLKNILFFKKNKQELLKTIETSTDKFVKNKEKFKSHCISKKNKIFMLNEQKIKIFVNKKNYKFLKNNTNWINKFIYEYNKVLSDNFFIITDKFWDILIREEKENLQINADCFYLINPKIKFWTRYIHYRFKEPKKISKELKKVDFKNKTWNFNFNLHIENASFATFKII